MILTSLCGAGSLTRFRDCKTFCRNATRAQKLFCICRQLMYSQLDFQDVKPSVKNLLGCFPRIPSLSVFKPTWGP